MSLTFLLLLQLIGELLVYLVFLYAAFQIILTQVYNYTHFHSVYFLEILLVLKFSKRVCALHFNDFKCICRMNQIEI